MSIETIPSLKGIHAILPDQIPAWLALEQTVGQILHQYGYRQIRLPYLEYTELFRRSIGEVTDVVEKEMYSFMDADDKSVSLRPEGTAGCVRACIEHGLLRQGAQRLWYSGPMFRRERPQRGRYRQFHQIGAEVFGLAGPAVDAEMLKMTWRLWRQLGLAGQVQLQINSLGTHEERQRYSTALVHYLQQHKNSLDEDSQRRLTRNPLRILDSKDAAVQVLLAQAPQLADFLGPESRDYLARLRVYLDDWQVPYLINPYLVRGLDYYCHLVFEWVTASTAAQNTICAGGRYDGLVTQLGGEPTPALGFALGVERVLMLLSAATVMMPAALDGYWIWVGEAAERRGWQLLEWCRDEIPQASWIGHCGGGNFKKQFAKADKSGARWAIVLGETEVAEHTVTIKSLRDPAVPQQTIPQAELVAYLRRQF